ncbi:uncharacterized protein LOC126724898 [Quercus robur]|uniref:uncharacterized protein LOC126724898 n=1 Tax=Quercus robur TaxID=38942 RepID=UPI002161F256|nr:uncharacterized protein LOC126724898 [Quercus robur]
MNVFLDFRDLWLGITSNNDHSLADRFAYVAWSIWHNRNALRLKTPCIPYKKIYAGMQDRVKEFHSAKSSTKLANHDSMVQPIISEPTHWKPPRNPFCKINFDGALFQDQKMASIGVVIRNPGGHVIGALSDRIFLPATVDEVEALACRKAISFALDLGVENVVLEGDSKIIIQALNADSSCASSYGHIIEDIRVLALDFASICFSHVKRREYCC